MLHRIDSQLNQVEVQPVIDPQADALLLHMEQTKPLLLAEFDAQLAPILARYKVYFCDKGTGLEQKLDRKDALETFGSTFVDWLARQEDSDNGAN